MEINYKLFTGINFALCRMPGTEFLKDQDIAYETAWDLWSNLMALGIMTVGIGFLGYIQLRRIKKLK
jgi:hypothetical protein